MMTCSDYGQHVLIALQSMQIAMTRFKKIMKDLNVVQNLFCLELDDSFLKRKYDDKHSCLLFLLAGQSCGSEATERSKPHHLNFLRIDSLPDVCDFPSSEVRNLTFSFAFYTDCT